MSCQIGIGSANPLWGGWIAVSIHGTQLRACQWRPVIDRVAPGLCHNIGQSLGE